MRTMTAVQRHAMIQAAAAAAAVFACHFEDKQPLLSVMMPLQTS